MANKLSINQIMGVLVLVALVLLYVPIPFIDGRNIAAVLFLISGLYLLVFSK